MKNKYEQPRCSSCRHYIIGRFDVPVCYKISEDTRHGLTEYVYPCAVRVKQTDKACNFYELSRQA